jgi:hypothetical protein
MTKWLLHRLSQKLRQNDKKTPETCEDPSATAKREGEGAHCKKRVTECRNAAVFSSIYLGTLLE